MCTKMWKAWITTSGGSRKEKYGSATKINYNL